MKKITLLMKTSAYAICVLVFLSSTISFSQTNRVKVSVNWPTNSYQNKVEVYDPANNLLATICNDADCYNASGSVGQYAGTYDFGCLALDPVALPNYYVKIYNVNNTAWSAGSSVTVNVADVDVMTDNGANASSAGFPINFNVNSATYCNFPDTDGDLVIDFVDQDDDNDGILDIDEGLGLDSFNCSVPSLVFRSPTLEVGDGTSVGSIYRFNNSIEGYDVLAEILEVDNATLVSMDNDGVNIADNLQAQITFTGTGLPGITFKFTIVDDDTSTPSATIFRIGGTTWDVDGGPNVRESVRYYNPSAYGLDNPSTLTIDNYADGAGVTGDYIDFPGFDNSTVLRSYFQFL
ncbi:MAG: hypothetical protein KJN66_05680, partial [Bacteroidia bacterium]|nr:hypothetical protein [Bacteroidia bacterium]